MRPQQARERFASSRVARLATVDPAGRPHLVPLVFVVAGDLVLSAVDSKPKRTTALRRLANVAHNPAVCLIVDQYDDADWTRLWWARADGTARVLAPDAAEGELAIQLLTGKYAQYWETAPAGPVLAVDVHRWSGWAAKLP